MAKTKQRKDEEVASLQDKLSRSKSVVFSNFEGLNVQDTTELRKQLRQANIDYFVTKKTLLKVVLKSQQIDDQPVDQLTGGIGVAVGYEDEVAPAKMLQQFAKKNEALKLIGGILEKRFLDGAAVKALAQLPSREELLSKLVWLCNYPMSGFVQVLSGTTRKLVYAIQAIKDSKA